MKKITFLNFHPAFTPPRSGGELRYWNIATRLAETFDVRMINPTYGEAQREEVQHAPHCVETRLPKTRAYNRWHHFFDRFAKFPECSALVTTLAVRWHRDYINLAREQAAASDIVIFSSPFMARVYPRAKPRQLIVYDAYNVEAKLAVEVFGDTVMGRWGADRIAKIEGELARRADLVLTCSDEDGDEMRYTHGIDGSQIVVVPNGVNIDQIRPANEIQRAAARRRLNLNEGDVAALFIGSAHPPNVEAARYLLRDVAPQVSATILIAGKVCDALADQPFPANVRLLGVVDDDTRTDLLHGADIALNPMFSGSGTNLKMLEFLAAGLPIVTTPLGARGLRLEHGVHAMIIGSEHFARCAQDVINDVDRRIRLRIDGRRHAEAHYSWDQIGSRLRDLLELKTSRRIIMLNDYPVTPVTSGGKVRLDAVARHLSETVAPVTVLTLTKSPRGRHNVLDRRCEEINIPRSLAMNVLDKLMCSRTNRIALDDVAAVVGWRLAGGMRRRLAREAQWASAIVLDHCYMVNFARAYAGKLPIIYESHNVEAVLKRSVYPHTDFGRWLLRKVERTEARASAMAKFVSCVSEADRVVFEKEFRVPGDKLIVAPNGVDCAGRSQTPVNLRARLRAAVGMNGESAIFFLGSGHPPNRDAMMFILKELAPMHSRAVFLAAGSVCGWFHSMPIPENVVLLGEITNEQKEFLLQACDIALNPLFDGSGSSLKVPEYLSAGLPVMSSEIGARGFATKDTSGILVCDTREMADCLYELIHDEEKRTRLAAEGRKLAEEKFDWRVTLRPLEERLRQILE